MSEWIKCSERLPKIGKWVLLRCILKYPKSGDPEIFVGCNGNYGKNGSFESAYGDGYVPSDLQITHWKDLPKPPKEEKEKV
jgi:hypothetical protein